MKKSFKYDFNLEAVVIAVVSNAAEYRLISMINKSFGVSFTRMLDFSMVEQLNNAIINFSVYQYFDTDQELSYYIVGNKSEDGYLIKEHKEIDYFLVMYGDEGRLKVADKILKLKGIDLCQMTFKMDLNKIKGKEKLIIE